MQKGNVLILLVLGVATAIAIAIIVIVTKNSTDSVQLSPTQAPSDVKTQEIIKQDTSDEPLSIEKDLEATEFSDLDTELSDIEKEANQ